MAETKKYQKRSQETIIAEIDGKIEYHKACIDKLEQKKAEVLAPSKSKQAKSLIELAEANGLSLEEIAKKCGLQLS